MAREMFYPEAFEEPDIWYIHETTDWLGRKMTMTLLNRQGKRNDSYNIAVNGVQLYYNRKDKLVFNETPWPLILGISDAMRFWAVQFPRISRRNCE